MCRLDGGDKQHDWGILYTAEPFGENHPREEESPAKDRGCACAHGEGGPDAATDPKPSRERQRETERGRERLRETERDRERERDLDAKVGPATSKRLGADAEV